MSRWLAAVLMAVGLAGAGAPPAFAAELGVTPGVVAQAPPGGSTAVIAEEAPSSISTDDQVRAFVVLAVCVAAIVGPVAFMMVRARRRRAPPTPATDG